MKIYSSHLLTAALVCGLSLCFSSCKDDEDNTIVEEETPAILLTVGNDVKSHGVETDVHSQVVEVPVKCNGGWAAYIPNDVDWVAVEGRKVFFDGDKTLRLCFDENHTGADRTTNLIIYTDEGTKTVIPVRQTQKWNDEAPSNESAQWFGNNGLGRGVNYPYLFENNPKPEQDFNPSLMTRPDPIFNWAKVTELQSRKQLSQEAYVENTFETIQFHDVMRDSLVSGMDTINMSFDLEIGVGFVNFRGHGEYTAEESKDALKQHYLVNRTATVYDVLLSPAELSQTANDLGGESQISEESYEAQLAQIDRQDSIYKKQNYDKYSRQAKRNKNITAEQLSGEYLEPWQEELLDEAYEALGCPDYAGIFSKSFGRLYFNLTRAVQSHDQEKIQARLEALDADYGPLFVARGEFGGSICMRIFVNKADIDSKGGFTGELAGGVDNIFNIEGSIYYYEELRRFLFESDAFVEVYGGNAVETGNKIMTHFAHATGTDRDEMLTILKDWGNSLMETKTDQGKTVPSRAIMQKMQLQGIWTLFRDDRVSKIVRDYMYEKHPTLSQYVGMLID